MDDLKMRAIFDDDTTNCHRFILESVDGVAGSIYIVKGKDIPKVLAIQLLTKADIEKDGGY